MKEREMRERERDNSIPLDTRRRRLSFEEMSRTIVALYFHS
jgi:hypothetical protein